jgi:hypothetical protein
MQPDPERLELTVLTKTSKGLEFRTLGADETANVLADIKAALEAEAGEAGTS